MSRNCASTLGLVMYDAREKNLNSLFSCGPIKSSGIRGRSGCFALLFQE